LLIAAATALPQATEQLSECAARSSSSMSISRVHLARDKFGGRLCGLCSDCCSTRDQANCRTDSLGCGGRTWVSHKPQWHVLLPTIQRGMPRKRPMKILITEVSNLSLRGGESWPSSEDREDWSTPMEEVFGEDDRGRVVFASSKDEIGRDGSLQQGEISAREGYRPGAEYEGESGDLSSGKLLAYVCARRACMRTYGFMDMHACVCMYICVVCV